MTMTMTTHRSTQVACPSPPSQDSGLPLLERIQYIFNIEIAFYRLAVNWILIYNDTFKLNENCITKQMIRFPIHLLVTHYF